jgi:hypothetical protein
MADMTTTDIAITFLGAGSSYGQSDSYTKAVDICAREAKSFAGAFGGFRKDAKPLPIMVYDYRPWEQITWSDGQVWGHVAKGDEGARILPTRIVWVDPHKLNVVKDQTYDEWLAENPRAKETI